MVSRWDVLGVYSQATAATATRFLDALQVRCPFQIKAVQVEDSPWRMDEGSEFIASFEAACQQRGIRLFVLPPRSPSSIAV